MHKCIAVGSNFKDTNCSFLNVYQFALNFNQSISTIKCILTNSHTYIIIFLRRLVLIDFFCLQHVPQLKATSRPKYREYTCQQFPDRISNNKSFPERRK